jgi:hypothetical protein
MKKIIFLISITFLVLQSCSSGDDNSSSSSTSNNNVNYSFTIINDGVVHKVKGNTANDYGFKGPVKNKCTASLGSQYGQSGITLTITDPTDSNYISGKPIDISIFGAPFVLGTNFMGTSWYLTTERSGASNGYIPINITDLGTPSTGSIGTSNYRFGNTIKGHYSGNYYTKPSGSNSATVSHTLSIQFEAVRLY